LANSIDDADPFHQRNTIGHYLVFFLGAYTKRSSFISHEGDYKNPTQIFGTILRDLVLRYKYDVFRANSNGTTVVSYCFRHLSVRHPARSLLVKIIRERVEHEKIGLRKLVHSGCPFLRRCGVVLDIQREIKLLVLMNEAKSVYKYVAARELYQRSPLDLATFLANHEK